MGFLLIIALASIVFCRYYLNDGSGIRSAVPIRKATRVINDCTRFKGVEAYLNKNE